MKNLLLIPITLMTFINVHSQTNYDSIKIVIHRMDSLEPFEDMIHESILLLQWCLNTDEFKSRLLSEEITEGERRFYDVDGEFVQEKRVTNLDVINVLYEAKEQYEQEAVPDTIYPGNHFGKGFDYPKTWDYSFKDENQLNVIDLRLRIRPDTDKPNALTAAWVQGEGVVNLVESYMSRLLARYEKGDINYVLKELSDTIIHEYMHLLHYHHNEKECSDSVPYKMGTIAGSIIYDHLSKVDLTSN